MKTYTITYNVKGGYQGAEVTTSAEGLTRLIQFVIDMLPKGIEIVSVKEVK